MSKSNDLKNKNEAIHIEKIVDKKELETLCKQFGFRLTSEQINALTIYLDFLSSWNKVTNLVGKNSWQDILTYLILDSFYLAEFLTELQLQKKVPAKKFDAWDLGAGAGLPGLPLRMLWRSGAYYLVEPRTKRALFMQAFLADCPLEYTFVFKGKAETFFKERKADLILSRAFMPYLELLKLVEGKLKNKGIVIVLSNEKAPETLDGWELVAQSEYTVFENKRYFWALSRA